MFLMEKMIAQFGAQPFEPLVHSMLKNDATSFRTTLFKILFAYSPVDAAPTTTALALALAALPQKEASSYGRVHLATDSVPGSAWELEIMLSAMSHITETPETKKIIFFLGGGSSLSFIRQHLAPAFMQWSQREQRTTHHPIISTVLHQAITVLSAEVDRPILPYPDWTRPCPLEATSASSYHNRTQSLLTTELRAFVADPARLHSYLSSSPA
jgi:hypothetical protein